MTSKFSGGSQNRAALRAAAKRNLFLDGPLASPDRTGNLQAPGIDRYPQPHDLRKVSLLLFPLRGRRRPGPSALSPESVLFNQPFFACTDPPRAIQERRRAPLTKRIRMGDVDGATGKRIGTIDE